MYERTGLDCVESCPREPSHKLDFGLWRYGRLLILQPIPWSYFYDSYMVCANARRAREGPPREMPISPSDEGSWCTERHDHWV